MQITITLDVNAEELDRKLAQARAVVAALEEAQRQLAELIGDTPHTRAPAKTEAPPGGVVATTNGHGPKPRPKGTPAKKSRRTFAPEVKAEAVAAARAIGVTKVAEQLDVLPGVVRNWVKAHPKDHAVAEPIRGTPPAVGESRDEWETRKRVAAGASL